MVRDCRRTKDNIEKLPKEAENIQERVIKKTERQARGKLRKLMAAKTADNDGDSCIEVERVKKLETRLQEKVEAAVRDTAPPQAEPEEPEVQTPGPSHVPDNKKRERKRAMQQDDDEDEEEPPLPPPPKKKDTNNKLIRYNHLKYNKFITKKCQKFLSS